VEAYATLPQIEMARLSPDGRRLAFLKNQDEWTFLATQEVGAGRAQPVLKTDNDRFRFGWIGWANPERILYSVAFPGPGLGAKATERRLLAINYDGSIPLALVEPHDRSKGRTDWFSRIQDRVVHLLPNDDNHILVSLDLESPDLPGVYRFDIYKGEKTRVEEHRAPIRNWTADAQGRVRVGYGFEDIDFSVILFDSKQGEWRTAWTWETLDDRAIEPLGFGTDPHWLYVRALKKGRMAVFKVDTRTEDTTFRVVASDPEYDLLGGLVRWPPSDDAVGIYYSGDSGRVIYWNEDAKRFQAAIDRALPGMTNYIGDWSRDGRRYLVYSSGHRKPGRYYVGDRDTHELWVVGAEYPQLDEDELSGREAITYRSREGLEIEGYLTLPRGRSPEMLPTIIHPDGWPASRDTAGFDYWTEFFASHGYAVLQMSFRGSAGHGPDFVGRGLESWGPEMQDDITDGARWLIEQGTSDPERICIVGASYGGYAALMGAVKTPDLYRCAVSFAGVSDLPALVRDSRLYPNKEIAALQIEERSAEREQLRAASPALHAESIKAPILLVHGERDRSVPVEQSRRMAKALRKHKKSHQFVELDEGTHLLTRSENRIKFFRLMEEFLAEHLQPRQSAPTP
jgi:dipeptidyl aminopeptidase/acylaminoacyl peptidase